MRIERSKSVASCYEDLVAETRKVAGGDMHEAWKASAATDDKDMSIPDIDYSLLEPFEDGFLDAIKERPDLLEVMAITRSAVTTTPISSVRTEPDRCASRSASRSGPCAGCA